MKSEWIQLRVSPILKEKVKEKAKEQQKSITEYIVDLIKKDLHQK